MSIKCEECGKEFDEIKREFQKKDLEGYIHAYCSQECTDKANP